jgi:hypothetical protein
MSPLPATCSQIPGSARRACNQWLFRSLITRGATGTNLVKWRSETKYKKETPPFLPLLGPLFQQWLNCQMREISHVTAGKINPLGGPTPLFVNYLAFHKATREVRR